MNRSSAAGTAAAALLIATPLAACGGNEPEEPDKPRITMPGEDGSPQDVQETEAGEPKDTEEAEDSEGEDGGEAQATDEQAHAAVETAESEVDGRLLELERDTEDGEEIWEAEVAAGDEEYEFDISLDGTEVLSSETEPLEDKHRDELDAASVEATDAIETAIGEVGGTIDEIELDDHAGTIVWEVDVLPEGNGSTEEVIIDAASGEVISSTAGG